MENQFNLNEHSHRRLNPLTGEWVMVSPHRTQRPWQGQVEKLAPEIRPAYDPGCYLCPGNQRAGDKINPPYESTFVFTNDFAALKPDGPKPAGGNPSILQAEAVHGTCRVICFSPRHDLTLPEMDIPEIQEVVDIWAEQTRELGEKYRWVQVFENKGAMMGSSNPHPHGQVWAMDQIPNEAAKEDRNQRAYFDQNGKPLLEEYLASELAAKERLVLEN
ncbi:MAG: galactose-1-phosphate uridylyltransferase, partial [Anaerolineales bacterium]|nr:galactose-1-phosphate uridylyltransferase [Anaerolineales bacterium]